jgi:hypothetical protein
MVTLGEGWHNNHHHYPAAARNGFFWWEIDITYYVLKMLEATGIIWELRQVPPELLDESLLDESRIATNASPAHPTQPQGAIRIEHTRSEAEASCQDSI